MNCNVIVPDNLETAEGFAPINLMKDDGQVICQLDLQYSMLAGIQNPVATSVDFLLIAASVYALDRLEKRKTASDGWTREYSLVIPVSNVTVWNSVKDNLIDCIEFLTGDFWDIRFIAQSSNPVRAVRRRKRSRNKNITTPNGNAVSLFSGGLDSLIGIIDWLESNPQQSLVVVGHHDKDIKGTFDDQKNLLDRLEVNYPGRISAVLVRVGCNNKYLKVTESTLRSRSLIFLALGIFVASFLGPSVPMLMPENGTIALNVPLIPSRRGTCSTRTAHPHYLSMLKLVLNGVGLTNEIKNPLEFKTKGEAVEQCLNPRLLRDLVPLSVSCGKRGHKIHFINSHAKGCGRCMPCIYRRAALHKVGWDDEQYGVDICEGELDILDHKKKANDLRACLSFLNSHFTSDQISTKLMANGSLDIRNLDLYAQMVSRTMNEIRALLRDKATPEIKRHAGI